MVITHDYRYREIAITFPLGLREGPYNQYKVVIPHTNPQTLWEIDTSNADFKQFTLVISVQNVPEFFIKHDSGSSHIPTANRWSGNNAWYRKTDIPRGEHYAQGLPTSLRRLKSRINPGGPWLLAKT
jgi:hypothetical protein